MSKWSNIAKLSRPNLYRVVARDRLFILLDKECNDHPVVWIKGPPGSGKTTLVASYLEERQLPAIWYQVDGGDSDLATFFYYMRLAGQQASTSKHLSLPLLTPEYLPDLPEFFRRFFRKLFAAIPETSILVFDNYQEIVSTSEFHSAIQGAITELPKSIHIIVISHLESPPHFARSLACNLIGQIDWEALRLTPTEIKAIITASSLQEFDENALQLLQVQTNGWAAGLVLMLERFRLSGTAHVLPTETMEFIFDYFANQIFDKLSVDMQRFLMSTATLPYLTVQMAQAISGNTSAHELLDFLYRRRLFIDLRAGDEISYQYHTLFREFLLARANKHFSGSELLDIKRMAANLAERNGKFKAAAELYAEIKEWTRLVEMIIRYATILLSQGRHQTLQSLIDYLPAEVSQTTSWLLYWRGMSHVLLNPREAIADFEQAYVMFQRENDLVGLFLICGSIIDAYVLIEDDMALVLTWAERLKDLLIQCHGFPSLDVEAKVLASMQGLIYAAPHHPLLETLEKRAEIVCETAIDPFLRFGIACAFIWLSLWRGDIYKARKIIEETNLLMTTMSAPPLDLIRWRVIEAAYAWSTTASYQIAEIKILEGIDISREAGITILDCMQWGNAVYSALSAGELTKAKFFLEKVEATLDVQGKHTLAEYRFLRAGIELLEGNLLAALDDASTSFNLHEKMGRQFLTEGARFGLAQILVELNQFEIAHFHLDQVIQYSRVMKSTFLEHQCLLIKAHAWLKQEEEARALTLLSEGLQLGRENDYIVLNLWWRPQVMARLFSLALKSGIEESYVTSVIRRRNIKAEPPEPDNWPWPIKVYTLGRFEITFDGNPFRISGKAQHKPLELLKCLCSYGGQAINQDRVIDALWPDSVSGAAEQALRTTLHRLRKLLQHAEAVRFEDRHLSLDRGYIWVDCLAFDRVAHHPDMTDRASLQRALNWYRGHFLEGDTSPWVLTFRDRSRIHYRRIIEQYGAMLEQDGDWLSAAECYLKAIEADPTVELFYCRLMDIYLQQDQRIEALAIYQRCHQALLTRLGINPSQNFQAIYQTLVKN
ncbi:MAG: hypothetical protein K2Q13_08905 [Nitrosomonas sp.]|uniref:BTAD domain-containing putative transcriptional regulator n=1 Tax=Nitrosomonas sp. TaxID=42353 RepID=UPI0025F60C54|nr:BTAD domain-containing putative transcriptional regulator [Nitrosomonas sp.]MBY0475162.1 hypothetical protein [Nitrosomonas sp.]